MLLRYMPRGVESIKVRRRPPVMIVCRGQSVTTDDNITSAAAEDETMTSGGGAWGGEMAESAAPDVGKITIPLNIMERCSLRESKSTEEGEPQKETVEVCVYRMCNELKRLYKTRPRMIRALCLG